VHSEKYIKLKSPGARLLCIKLATDKKLAYFAFICGKKCFLFLENIRVDSSEFDFEGVILNDSLRQALQFSIKYPVFSVSAPEGDV